MQLLSQGCSYVLGIEQCCTLTKIFRLVVICQFFEIQEFIPQNIYSLLYYLNLVHLQVIILLYVAGMPHAVP